MVERSTDDAGDGLLDRARAPLRRRFVPLAERMRPRRLGDVVGQDHLLAEGGSIRECLAAGVLPSMVLWGPPGSGKTTIARLVAAEVNYAFEPFSAVLGGVKDVREIMDRARTRIGLGGRPTALFVDEIHRFNKAQQDAFLPHTESGDITLIGATTENPSFALNAALLSRAQVFQLSALDTDALSRILAAATEDDERGLGASAVEVVPEALERLAAAADGDARRALGWIEELVVTAERRGQVAVTANDVERIIRARPLRYDRKGDGHYGLTSALIKSMRGSNPDAAVYYLARMLESGEDPRFIARRLVIFASEDVGNAEPAALMVSTAAQQATLTIGMPEVAIVLSQAVTYCASAPKSNASYQALRLAQEAAREAGSVPVPNHLVNAPTKLMRDLGRGQDYRYPHDAPGAYVPGVDYLPEALRGRRFYEPTSHGRERLIAERLAHWRGQDAAVRAGETRDGEGAEST